MNSSYFTQITRIVLQHYADAERQSDSVCVRAVSVRESKRAHERKWDTNYRQFTESD